MRLASQAAVDKLRPTGRDVIHRCAGPGGGFGLRIQPSGRATWVIDYRTREGVLRRAKLGPREIGLAEARRRAVRILGEAYEGGDPTRERRLGLRRRGVADVLDLYEAGTGVKLRRHHLAALRNRPAAAVTFKTIADLHERITDEYGPAAANTAVEALKRAWGWCHARRADLDPLLPEYPAARLRLNRKGVRGQTFGDDGYRAFGRALRAAQAAQPSYALWCLELLALTGLRRTEGAGIEIARINREGGYIGTGDKVKDEKLTPITPALARLLDRIPQGHGGRWLFPAKGAAHRGKPLSDLSRPFHALLADARLDDLVIHDLRRSWIEVGSVKLGLAAWKAATAEAVDHASPDMIDLHYTPQSLSSKLAMASAISAYIENLLDS